MSQQPRPDLSVPRPSWFTLASAIAVLLLLATAARAAEPEDPKPTTRTNRNIEGWTVRIDDRLLQKPNDELGTRAINLLQSELAAIRSVMAADRVAMLQRVTIVLDLSHGKLRSEQYHPSAGWLVGNGYARDLAKCVHLPNAAYFAAARHVNEQPWAVLHELAHAYHDQMLSFDNPRVLEAWKAYKATGRGESVLHVNSRKTRHYALTDQMEFFSEMTESYFGRNDFFPFNRGELLTAEPEIYALMRSTWGDVLRGQGVADAAVSRQFGATRHDFTVNGQKAFVLLPTRPAPQGDRPWVWYAPTLTGQCPNAVHEWLFTRLLAGGFAIVGIDVGESYGNPAGRTAYTDFHRLLVDRYALSPKACLLPQSRGGLMFYNWAAEHPERVQCIAGIYPVCDPSSWPGLAKASPAFGMTEDELRKHLDEHNPIARLAPLAKARVPILHLHGTADTVVPLEANSGEVARRYRALGGEMTLMAIDGKGHEEVPEFFQSRKLLDFLLSQPTGRVDTTRQ